jgi:hypothetical protein
MQAKVTTAFIGKPDDEACARTVAIGEQITGKLAQAAVGAGYAEPEGGAAPVAAEKPAKRKR